MKIDKDELKNSDLVESTFNFWFNDNEHIRSPFPVYIQPQLKREATEKFFEWVDGIKENAKDELNDEIISEKFEEIIFEKAMNLVITNDEKITIQYPFLPRTGDIIYQNAELNTGKSSIIDRLLTKEADHTFLKIYLLNEESNEKWETMFELPA